MSKIKLLLVVCVASFFLAEAASDKKVVCYWGSWSVYRKNDGEFDLSLLDPKLCTHLIYTFVGLSDNDEVKSLDPWCDFPDGGGKDNIGKFNRLREQNPDLKTMVAIGGWNQGSANYSRVAADPARRRKLVESAVKFVKKYGFNGFDVDWEYPALAGKDEDLGVRPNPEDRQNYVLLLKELRERFDQEGLLLSAAVGAPESTASVSYDIPKMSKYLDFINIMAYDMYGAYSKTGMNAALYPASSDSGNQAKLNIDSVVKYWLSQGALSEKIILGVPFYGRSFSLSNPQSSGLGASSSKGIAGPYTLEPGMWGYNEICEKFQKEKWNVHFDKERQVPYAVHGNNWVSYDDEKSIKEKAKLIKKYNLGGGMVWSIETDDFRGKCGKKWPLLKALNSELRNRVSSSTTASRPKGMALKSQPKKSSQQQQKDHSQKSKPEHSQPQVTQKPTVNNGQICQAPGMTKDPQNCAKFYYCLSYKGQYIAHSRDCPAGTKYDVSKRNCNHIAHVKC